MTDTHIGLSMIDQPLEEKACSYTVLNKDFSLKHPTVLYFGGRLNVYHELACSGIRFVERVLAPLKITRNNVHFVAVAYQGMSIEEARAEELYHRLHKQGILPTQNNKESAFYGFDTKRLQYPSYLCELYEDYFKHLVSRTLPGGGVEKLSPEEAQKNMRHVNIVAHSHGTCALSIFGDMMFDKMLDLGYTKKETLQILQQVFVLGLGTTIPLGVSKFTTVNFVSRQDKMATQGFLPITFNSLMCRQMSATRQGCQYYPLTDREGVLAVDELCQENGAGKDKIEHAIKNYLTELNEKTAHGRTATEIALDLFAAGICNSIFNSRVKGHLVPLKQALNEMQTPAFLQAKQSGADEMAIFKEYLALPVTMLRACGNSR